MNSCIIGGPLWKLNIFPSTEQTFWSRVDKRERRDCWLWQGGLTAKRYGQFSVRGRPMLAHRVAWIIHHRIAVPAGKRIIQTCWNRLCCNPAHLRLGTYKTHAARGNKSGRQTKPEAWSGKSVGTSKTSQNCPVSVELSEATTPGIATNLGMTA